MEPKIIEKKIALFLLFVFIIVGGYLRVIKLDRPMFWVDEFKHVFAAKGIIETGKPMLPSGSLYTRSIIYTYILSLFFKLFGTNEVTARLPSVIFGVLMIPLTYYVASRLINRNTGIISAFLVALSPFSIRWSSTCRMYSLFQPLYLLSVFYFFKAFEERDEIYKIGFSFYSIKKYLIFFLIYIPTFLTHTLSILLIPTTFIYILLMFFLVFFKKGLNLALYSKYPKGSILILIIGLISLFLFIYVRKKNPLDLSRFMMYPPNWGLMYAYNIDFYHRAIRGMYPMFYYCYPIALFMLILKKPKIGLYIGSCFLVPFIALSFIFVWRNLRYIFFVFPFFLITISFLIEHILYYSWKLFKSLASSFLSNSRMVRTSKAVILIGSISMILISFPLLFLWIKKLEYGSPSVSSNEFRKFIDIVKEEINPEDLIICVNPFFTEYYFSRTPDSIINLYFPSRKRKIHRKKREKGILLINDSEELKLLENSGKRIWIITWRNILKRRRKDIYNYLNDNYKLYSLSEGGVKVYYKCGNQEN